MEKKEKMKIRFNFLIILILSFNLLNFNNLMGDEKAKEIDDIFQLSLKELMNVEVKTTTKIDVKINKAPGAVYRYNKSDFKNYGLQSIDDLYWYIPNFQPYKHKKNDVVVIRGVIHRTNNRTQHIIDNFIVRNGVYYHEELNLFIPLEWIDNIEIMAGPESSLYGANAFSGIVSLNLLGFNEDEELKISTQTLIAPLLPIGTLTFRNKNIVFGVSAANGKIQTPEFNIDGTEFSQSNNINYYHTFLKYNLFNKGYFYLRHGNYEKPYLYNKSTKNFSLISTPTIIGINLNFGEKNEKGKISVKANYNIINFKEEGYKKEEYTLERQNTIFSNVEISYNKLFNDIDFLSGLSYIFEKPVSVDINNETMLEDSNVSLTNIAAFFQGIFKLTKKFTMTLGLRFDNFNRFEDTLNERGAIVYSFGNNSNLKLMFGTAMRTPNLREWDKNMEGTSFIQPMIAPEHFKTAEISYNKVFNKFYFDIMFFYNQFKDMILQKDTPPTEDNPEGGADEYFYNSENLVAMKGIEINARYKNDKIDISSSLSYLNTNNGEGEEIPYIRGNKFTFNIAYNYLKNHTITFGLIGFGNISNNDQNDQYYLDDQPSSFIYINSSLSGKISKHIEYAIGLRNFTNQTTYDPYYLSSKYRNIQRLDKKIWLSFIYTF